MCLQGKMSLETIQIELILICMQRNDMLHSSSDEYEGTKTKLHPFMPSHTNKEE